MYNGFKQVLFHVMGLPGSQTGFLSNVCAGHSSLDPLIQQHHVTSLCSATAGPSHTTVVFINFRPSTKVVQRSYEVPTEVPCEAHPREPMPA